MNAVASPPAASPPPPRFKPEKPRPDFPLTASGNGQWVKKIRGEVINFGVWADPVAAEVRLKREFDDWKAGRNPRAVPSSGDACTLLELTDRWLVMRRGLLKATDPMERIARVTYKGSKAAMDKLVELMGKNSDPMTWTPTDFASLRAKFGAKVSPATKSQRIMYTRSMFGWCATTKVDGLFLIPRIPDWGDRFKNVAKGEKELYRYEYQKEHGERVFEIEDARRILKALDDAVNAKPHKFTGSRVEWREMVSARLVRACTYLAANTGANAADIAKLTFAELDLNARYIERLRAKTAVLWQATLWLETAGAIRQYRQVRPDPIRPEWRDLVFITTDGYPVKHGEAAVDEGDKDNRTDVLRQTTSKLLKRLGLKQKGVTFGAWRGTFRSLASDALGVNIGDIRRVDAINRIMAHTMPGVTNRYTALKPDQLRPFTEAVRAKLLPEKSGDAPQSGRRSSPHYLRLVS